MARYVKRGKSWQYEISYKDDDGKYKKLRKSGFPRKTDAIAEAAEVESRMAKGFEVASADVLLYDHFTQWAEIYKKGKVSKKTYSNYENTKKTLKNFFPHDTLKKMTRSLYQKRLNELSKIYGTITISHFNSKVRASIQNAVQDGKIPYDFTIKAITKGKNLNKKDEDKFLNYDEFSRLMAAAHDKLDPRDPRYFLIYLAGATGARFAELLGLTWDRIDFEKNVLTIDRTWDYSYHNGFLPTKNQSSVRTISIDPKIMLILRDYRKRQKTLFESLKIDPPFDFLIYRLDGRVVRNPSINYKLKKLCKTVGINKDFSFHGLRHTHASILLYKGVNIMSVSKRLGHKNTTVTQNVYAHILKELEETEDKKINAILTDIFTF